MYPSKLIGKLSGPERVAQKYAQLIVSGEMAPGDYLPTEHAIATECGVGRPAVREGIQRLSAASIVETRHGLGTRVCPPERWNLFDPLVLQAFLTSGRLPEIVDELLDLRRMVEVEAAVAAAGHNDQTKLLKLRRWLERMEMTLEQDETFTAADTAFHNIIISMSGNRFIQGITRFLDPLFSEGRRLTSVHGGVSGRQRAQQSHRVIFEAIKVGDKESVRLEMESHMRQFEEDMRRAILSHGEVNIE